MSLRQFMSHPEADSLRFNCRVLFLAATTNEETKVNTCETNPWMGRIEAEFQQVKEKNLRLIQAGVNYFNPLLAVRKRHDETGLHSRFLYSLLNPAGDHFQGSFFLKKFFALVGMDVSSAELDTAKVFRERDRIDLLIETKDRVVIIENKIYAGDQPKQIERYLELVTQRDQEKAQKGNQSISVIYLTPYGVKPTRQSLGKWKLQDSADGASHPLLLLSYKEIQAWCLDSMAELPLEATTLCMAIAHYKEALDRLYLKTKSSIGASANLQDMQIQTNQDFFLALGPTIQKSLLNTFKKEPRLLETCALFKDNLVPYSGLISPPKLIQSSFNRLLQGFRDGLDQCAIERSMVSASTKDMVEFSILNESVNWYTENKNRTTKNKFLMYRPRSATDNAWYVLLFAKYRVYHGFVCLKDKVLVAEGSPDFCLDTGKLRELGLAPHHKWEKLTSRFYSESIAIAHYDDEEFKINVISDFLADPRGFFKQESLRLIEGYWGPLETADNTVKQFYLSHS